MNDINNNHNEQRFPSDMTLSQIVMDNHHTSPIFEEYGLDFCCNGNKTLSRACEEKGISVDDVINKLNKINETQQSDIKKYSRWELDFLVDFIVNTHHNYVREAIPEIDSHGEAVVNAHGQNHPEILEIQKIFTSVYKELKHHLLKEEEILFPYIKYLAKVKKDSVKFERPYFGTIKNPIKMMEAEHVNAGEGMAEINRLSKSYMLPEDACPTYKIYYIQLKEFEADLHQHVFLENSILFPGAIELEDKLMSF